MNYVNLGKCGLKVSRICFGMMSFGSPSWKLATWVRPIEDGMPLIRKAIESGINFFDTAEMYSNGLSEELTGRALKEYARRDEVVIATKVFYGTHLDHGPKPNQIGLSRKHIMCELDASLKRLDTDYIDLYIIHRWDNDTPIEETMEALNDVVKAGKVLYIGASSMFTWQFAKAQHVAAINGWVQFVSMQNHYNLIYREEEKEMIPFCVDQGIGITPWSPLARGFLAGNRTRGKGGDTMRSESDEWAHGAYYQQSDFDVVEAVKEVANGQGVSPAQIAMAWMLHKNFITAPIIGVSRANHLEEMLSALDIELSDEEISRLERDYKPHPVTF